MPYSASRGGLTGVGDSRDTVTTRHPSAAMKSPPPSSNPDGFVARLRAGGIEPGDSDAVRLAKSLLMLATGLTSLASIFWVAIYWRLGPAYSSTLPVAFQVLLVGNMVIFVATRNFRLFSVTQLGLLLFLPFVAQWLMGNFIASSGIVLWGLLAPIGALLCFGVNASLGWFIAWAVLTAVTGVVDFYLAEFALSSKQAVPMSTSIAFFALNFIAVATIIYMLLRESTIERLKIQRGLEAAHDALVVEQNHSERLLLNILPAPIADRLKHSGQTIADGFPDATVMFADIVNFTQVASKMTPGQVFAMLNKIFSAFDELAEQYQIEKIKTIGDAYMVAGGVVQTIDAYTAAVADLAIDMRDLLHRDFKVNEAHLDIRIGMATGPVVAGVVGKKKFIYDLWGDTVNIASRITSEGKPGVILCDATTYERLADSFVFRPPVELALKGKGNMTAYQLVARK